MALWELKYVNFVQQGYSDSSPITIINSCMQHLHFWDDAIKKTNKQTEKQGRKCQHGMCSQPLWLKGEETHWGSVQTTGWVHLSPHKHVGSGPQESFLAFKETECSRSKNQSKSTTWLLIKPEKSGEMQTVYQWIILPNPRTPSPGFKEVFKDFAKFFIKKKKEKSHLLHNIFGSAKLRALRECCVKKNNKKK